MLYEVITLSDRIVMMTNGPHATLGDILDNTLPRPRVREEIFEHPDYYRLRDHLIDFLEEQDEKKEALKKTGTERNNFV